MNSHGTFGTSFPPHCQGTLPFLLFPLSDPIFLVSIRIFFLPSFYRTLLFSPPVFISRILLFSHEFTLGLNHKLRLPRLTFHLLTSPPLIWPSPVVPNSWPCALYPMAPIIDAEAFPGTAEARSIPLRFPLSGPMPTPPRKSHPRYLFYRVLSTFSWRLLCGQSQGP